AVLRSVPTRRSSDLDFGPLNNSAQFERVLGLLERLPAHARVETGGHRVGERGYFIAPTVVTGLRQDDELVKDETFAPVLTVQPRSEEHTSELQSREN